MAYSVVDPDLQIRGPPNHPDPRIRGALSKKFSQLFRSLFVLKIRGVQGPRATPLDPPLIMGTNIGSWKQTAKYRTLYNRWHSLQYGGALISTNSGACWNGGVSYKNIFLSDQHQISPHNINT